jgi:adenosine deaminase CECR1
MASRSVKPALLLAACCAAASGCASSKAGSVGAVAGGAAPGTTESYPDLASYLEARARLVEREQTRRLSSALVLSAEEEAASRRLAALRKAEEQRVGTYFPPAHSYLLDRTKRLIEASPLLEVMRRLPKGGILHVHGSAGGDFRWLVSQATERPDCYMFTGEQGPIVRGALRFFATPPEGPWRQVKALRSEAPDPQAFDEQLYRSVTLGEEEREAPDIWAEFTDCFARLWGLFADASVRSGHWRRMLNGLIDENVQYVEFRGWPGEEAVLQEARRRDPHFAVKFIPAGGRSSDRERMREMLERALAERERDPRRAVGFDLIQEEDRTHGTLFFAEEILAARREAERRGLSLPLFLHSGETSRAQSENLYDALLLGASRIGHGLALVRHPLLMEMARDRGIAIEVCPISNQLLGYVADLRAHPAVAYINAGIPVVLSPDDPGMMRHTLSHDFYAAFLAWDLDLRELKQLAMNSLLHSAMAPEEKRHALEVWRERWAEFVRWLNDAG